MRRGVLSVVFWLAVWNGVHAATPEPRSSPPATSSAKGLSAKAPADVYFGPFGMSPLSIRSTIGFLGRQYHYRTITDRDLLRKALQTEDALRKWRTAYPDDPWLAPTFFHLEQLYQAVQTQEARKHATAILNDVVLNYPSTEQGHLSRARLAAGFPPLVPETPLVSTPAPTSAPSASPAQSPAYRVHPSQARPAPPRRHPARRRVLRRRRVLFENAGSRRPAGKVAVPL
jgi:hypothetical protein